ncbi:MAG: hypothetical protein JXR52_13240 [Bacteroidales bacterium]|nr:hypothetical protein [Bacteroidales bacterium]MBN2699783.1 hypothetical protein [Bacteroidales bacterium]
MKSLQRIFSFAGTMFFLVFFLSSLLPAQAPLQPPTGFTYQAVARDNSGNPLPSQDLTVRISIHEDNLSGTLVWQEDHDLATNPFGLFDLVVGGPNAYGQTGSVDAFADIDWSARQYYMNVKVRIDNEFLDMGGSPIQTVPVAQFARSAKNSSGTFSVQADQPGSPGESLFEVKRSDGSVAFAVYEDSVRVYFNSDGTKGLKGGFAVGGYSGTKSISEDFLRVTPDSVRVYVSTNNIKGVKGGFAVGGYSGTKGLAEEYLRITPDSVRIFSSVSDGGVIPRNIAIGYGAVATGRYSAAIGVRSLASGLASFSLGLESRATADNSIAFGSGARSTEKNSVSVGYKSEANGERSIAIGSQFTHIFTLLPYFKYTGKGDSKGEFIPWDPIITPDFKSISYDAPNVADGKYSIAFGNGNYSNNGGMALGSANSSTGFGSVAIGLSNKAENTNAFAAGYKSQATGYYTTAFGNNTFAKSYGVFVLGQYNEDFGDSTVWRETDPLFIVGNGLNDENRNNALTIYKNGRSVFMGSDANLSLNDRRTIFSYNPFTQQWNTYKNIYGVRSYVNRVNTYVDYFYSGYFYDTGSAGVYNGFYADLRTGAGFDVAEYYYDMNADTEPGDVVIADPDHTSSVVKSGKAFQTSVVGVISTDPHLVMGLDLVVDEATGTPRPGVNGTRLALNGRVPCKVTDENGPITPGDLLTTSSTPGHAMRWSLMDVSKAKDFEELKSMLAENEKRRNAVIGKAVEAFDGGTGKIMVLIALQ